MRACWALATPVSSAVTRHKTGLNCTLCVHTAVTLSVHPHCAPAHILCRRNLFEDSAEQRQPSNPSAKAPSAADAGEAGEGAGAPHRPRSNRQRTAQMGLWGEDMDLNMLLPYPAPPPLQQPPAPRGLGFGAHPVAHPAVYLGAYGASHPSRDAAMRVAETDDDHRLAELLDQLAVPGGAEVRAGPGAGGPQPSTVAGGAWGRRRQEGVGAGAEGRREEVFAERESLRERLGALLAARMGRKCVSDRTSSFSLPFYEP